MTVYVIPLVQFASRGAIQRPRRNILILIPQNPPAAPASFPFATTARREERKAMPIWPASKFPPPSRPIHDMASIHGACVWNCRSADGWCGLGSFASHRITPKKMLFLRKCSAPRPDAGQVHATPEIFFGGFGNCLL